jgi:hypothetical protein
MRIVDISKEKEAHDFAECATRYFAENPSCFTYANGDPTPGEFFAIRWNSFTVLVVRLDESFVPACYPTYQFIKADLPRLATNPSS